MKRNNSPIPSEQFQETKNTKSYGIHIPLQERLQNTFNILYRPTTNTEHTKKLSPLGQEHWLLKLQKESVIDKPAVSPDESARSELQSVMGPTQSAD
jgi:hypothetical protein